MCLPFSPLNIWFLVILFHLFLHNASKFSKIGDGDVVLRVDKVAHSLRSLLYIRPFEPDGFIDIKSLFLLSSLSSSVISSQAFSFAMLSDFVFYLISYHVVDLLEQHSLHILGGVMAAPLRPSFKRSFASHFSLPLSSSFINPASSLISFLSYSTWPICRLMCLVLISEPPSFR